MNKILKKVITLGIITAIGSSFIGCGRSTGGNATSGNIQQKMARSL